MRKSLRMIQRMREIFAERITEPASDEDAVAFDLIQVAHELASELETEFGLRKGSMNELMRRLVRDHVDAQARDYIRNLNVEAEEVDERFNRLGQLMLNFTDHCISDGSFVTRCEEYNTPLVSIVRELIKGLDPEYVKSRWIFAYASMMSQICIAVRYQALMELANFAGVKLPPEFAE